MYPSLKEKKKSLQICIDLISTFQLFKYLQTCYEAYTSCVSLTWKPTQIYKQNTSKAMKTMNFQLKRGFSEKVTFGSDRITINPQRDLQNCPYLQFHSLLAPSCLCQANGNLLTLLVMYLIPLGFIHPYPKQSHVDILRVRLPTPTGLSALKDFLNISFMCPPKFWKNSPGK